MDENENITTEVSETENDNSFDEGWNDSTAVNSALEDETTEEETEAVEAEEELTDQTAEAKEETEEPQKAEETITENKDDIADQQFTLKHLDDVKTVGREEVIRLAQKGMDYDRQKERYDTLTRSVEDHEEFLKELAASSGVSVDELIDTSRAGMLAKKDGLDLATARERINLKKQEKALSARESKLNESEKQKEQADEAKSKRDADFLSFVKAYPDVKATDIPKEVWDEVGKGVSLLDAYARHEAAQLKAENKRLAGELEALKQNNENRQKAAGSQKSAGNKNTKPDPFDEGWDD